MATRMQQRRGTSEQWTTVNPVLAEGEIGLETDTNKFKIGNGTTAWATLGYASLSSADLANYATEEYVDGAVSALVGAAPGLLDTIQELSAALGNDENFAITVTNAIAAKPDSISELDDVILSTPTPDDVLQWNGSAWVNATPPIGPEGPPGPAGADGVNGVDGVPGSPGTDGADGLSAYQIALNAGFLGTEQDWLDSLVGADGADGSSVTYMGYYDSGVTYNKGDVVEVTVPSSSQNPYPPQPLYVSLIPNNLGNDPESQPTAWAFLVNNISQEAMGNKQNVVTGVTDLEISYLDGVTSNIQTQLDSKSPLAGSTSITTVGTVTNATSPTAAGSKGLRNITISTSAPSGGADGDVWMKYIN